MEEMPVITGLTLEQLRTLVGSAQMAIRQQLKIPPPPPQGPDHAPDTLTGPPGPPDPEEVIQVDHEDDQSWGDWQPGDGDWQPGDEEPSGTYRMPMPKWGAKSMPRPAQSLMALGVPQGPRGSPRGCPRQSPRSRSAYGDNEQQRWLHQGSQDHYRRRSEQEWGGITPGEPGNPVRRQPLKTFMNLEHLPTTASTG